MTLEQEHYILMRVIRSREEKLLKPFDIQKRMRLDEDILNHVPEIFVVQEAYIFSGTRHFTKFFSNSNVIKMTRWLLNFNSKMLHPTNILCHGYVQTPEGEDKYITTVHLSQLSKYAPI